jgi:hypothetical protein
MLELFGMVELAKLAVEVLKAIITVIVDLGKSLGLIEDNENPEELGDKALQAEEDGMGPDSFDSWSDYKTMLDNYQTDPDRSLKTSQQEKLAAAAGVLIKGLEEAMGSLGSEKLILKKIGEDPDFFNAERMEQYVKIFKESNTDLDNAAKYFDRVLDPDTRSEVGQLIESAERKLNPGKSEAQIDQKIDDHMVPFR